MRLRLLPWIWEHIELLWDDAWDLNVIMKVDRSLASNVKYFCTLLCPYELVLTRSRHRFMTLHSPWRVAEFPLLGKCLQSLPNLYTLVIASPDSNITNSLENALKGCKFPQIKALILPSSAYPLLKRCRNAEDVDCVVGDRPTHTEKLPEFLASIRGSKVKRLAIPLVSNCDTPSKWPATPCRGVMG